MYSKLRKFLIVSILPLYFIACSDSPGPVGYSLLNPNDLIYLSEVSSDSLNQTSSYQIHSVNNAGLTQVLLGKYENAEASFLTKFYFGSLADTILSYINEDSIVIKSAVVEMVSVYNLGEAGNQFDYSVHKINEGWTSDNFNADSLSILNYDAADISTNRTVSNDSVYSFDLNNDLVMQWLKATADTSLGIENNGILVNPSSSTNKVIGFQTYTTSESLYDKIMRLKVGLYKIGWEDTVFSFISSSAVHVIKGNLPPINPDYIYIQGGLHIHAKLKFDLPVFSPYTTINDAKLTLSVETVESNIGDPSSEYLYVRFLTDSINIEYDSSNTAYLSKDGDKYSGDISNYIQRWIKGEKNYGMLIYFLDQIQIVDLLAIPSSTIIDKSKRPSLIIKYSTKK